MSKFISTMDDRFQYINVDLIIEIEYPARDIYEVQHYNYAYARMTNNMRYKISSDDAKRLLGELENDN